MLVKGGPGVLSNHPLQGHHMSIVAPQIIGNVTVQQFVQINNKENMLFHWSFLLTHWSYISFALSHQFETWDWAIFLLICWYIDLLHVSQCSLPVFDIAEQTNLGRIDLHLWSTMHRCHSSGNTTLLHACTADCWWWLCFPLSNNSACFSGIIFEDALAPVYLRAKHGCKGCVY